MNNFNEYFRQVIFFLIIATLGVLIIFQIQFIMSAILGAITLYILCRKYYFKVVFEKKWPRFLSAFLFTTMAAIILLIPFGILVSVMAPRFNDFYNSGGELFVGIQEIIKEISVRTGIDLTKNPELQNIPYTISTYIPKIIGTAGTILVNMGVSFFMLFFMFYNASRMEASLLQYIPLKKDNVHRITSETKSIVTSYAIGIPILAIAQGLAAFIGYYIFGIKDPLLWAFATSVCSVIPFIGSGLIILPLVVFLAASHQTGDAIGLAIYCLAVVMNIDNVLRLFLLKAFADIHPLITLFGVITGIKLFGFLGLIFGPLLVSYFLLLLKIYTAEFSTDKAHEST